MKIMFDILGLLLYLFGIIGRNKLLLTGIVSFIIFVRICIFQMNPLSSTLIFPFNSYYGRLSNS